MNKEMLKESEVYLDYIPMGGIHPSLKDHILTAIMKAYLDGVEDGKRRMIKEI